MKIEYRGFEFHFDGVPSKEELEHRYREQVAALEGRVADAQKNLIERVERDGDLVASYSQRRFWLLYEASERNWAYHLPAIVELEGACDAELLQTAFETVIARHEVLRTSFHLRDDGAVVQRIHDAVPFRLRYVDWSDREAVEIGSDHPDFVEESRAPFSLAQPPLVRATLYRLAPERHTLTLVLHHIVADGSQLFLRDVYESYRALSEGTPSRLPPLPIQYADYAAWQRRLDDDDRIKEELAYWKEKLADVEPLDLPLDRPRPAEPSRRGAVHRWSLSEELSERLQELARRQGVTLFQLMLAALQLFLSRYSGQSDVTVGTLVSAQQRHGHLEHLLGCFLNTLVMRADVSGERSFAEFLDDVRHTATQAHAHQDVPFERVVEELGARRGTGHNPLFQTMLIFNRPVSTDLPTAGLRITRTEIPYPGAHFDMTLFVNCGERRIDLVFRYATDLFDATTIERAAKHFEQLLHDVVARPQAPLPELQMLLPEEREQLANTWSRGASIEPAGPVHRMFEDRASKNPDATALVLDEGEWSYEELNAHANRIAHRLMELGAGPDEIVAVHVKRSPQLLASLIGVLKAGAAYVALQPELPPSRLAYVLQDSGARVVVTDDAAGLDYGARSLVDVASQNLAAMPATDPRVEVHPDNLAYVLYTSGSTGRPKGVEVPHRAVTNLVCSLQHHFRLDDTAVGLLKTPFSFDVSVSEIWSILTAGARLVVTRPEGEKDPHYLVEQIREHRVTFLRCVPTTLQLILDGPGLRACDSLKYVVCAGEALTTRVRDEFGDQSKAGLYNLLGATETCVDTTFWQCKPHDEKPVAVGGPLPNYETFVLDDRGYLVPVGIYGELCVAGPSVARGYHGMARRTAQSFVPHPLASERGARVYCTGDSVRWRQDAALVYGGRRDDQLQVRGVRVELGEIEQKLQSLPGIAQAVVVPLNARDGRADGLVAYVVPAEEGNQRSDDVPR